MYKTMHFICIHHLLRAVIGKYFEDVVAMTVKFSESSSAVTARQCIPRSDVAGAAFLLGYTEPFSIPRNKVILRSRRMGDGVLGWPRSHERCGLPALQGPIAGSPKK